MNTLYHQHASHGLQSMTVYQCRPQPHHHNNIRVMETGVKNKSDQENINVKNLEIIQYPTPTISTPTIFIERRVSVVKEVHF